LLSLAFVAVTKQVPGDAAVKVDPLSVQVVVPALCEYAILPLPEPPDVVSERFVPKFPEVEVIERLAWLPLATVTTCVVVAGL
jgi:hypothetical protein